MIRLASAGDIPALARVWHDGWHDGHAHLSPEVALGRPFEFFQPRIETTLPDCVVATVDEEIVGFAGWHGDGIGQVFILPAWHGRGVAPLVLAAAEAKLKEQGHDRIWLQCQVGNTRARRFYEKHGWHVAREAEVTVGTMEGRKPQFVWRMEKVLDNPETSHPVALRKGMMPNVYADGLFYIGRVAECPRSIEPGEDGVATIWIECGAYPVDVWVTGKQFELRDGPSVVAARAVIVSVAKLEK